MSGLRVRIDVPEDASVATKWLVTENLSSEAVAILGSDAELVAPDLLPIEVGNVLWK